MASPTKKHKTRRTAKLIKAGTWRKNKLRREGSTSANLPLTKPNANELAQAAAKAKAATV